jgi:glycosyltransferase involved in cell wall biosynthesis
MTRRIALIATTTASEPPELIAARVRHLADRGWDARLLCRGDRWEHEPAAQALGERLELSAAAETAVGEFDMRLMRLRPDVVHFHSAWAASKAMGVLPELGSAVVVSLRDDGQDLAIPDAEAVSAATGLLLVPSRAVLERAAARGWRTERAVVLEAPPVGVEPAPDVRPRRNGHLRLLSFGPLIWEHGLEHAIHAVALTRARGGDCRLRIVGAGEHLHAVAFARHQLGLTDIVEIVKPEDAGALADELRDADVLLDPAVADALPGTPLATAAAAGIPFVATRRPGLPAERGLVVERRDPAGIAEAVLRLATDQELARHLAQAGRREAAQALAAHLEQLEELYLRTVG